MTTEEAITEVKALITLLESKPPSKIGEKVHQALGHLINKITIQAKTINELRKNDITSG